MPTEKTHPTPLRQPGAQLSPRNQQLDILRGVAILLVLGRHYNYFRIWNRVGWAGVDLFFVLSGFLISGLLFSEYKKYGQIDVKRFWIRRGLKIYPPFYALMALTVLAVAPRLRLTWGRIVAELFFAQGYLPHMWSHTWSLAVEEHCYLLLPLMLAVMIRFSRDKANPFRAIPWVLIPIAVTCLTFRLLAFLRGSPWADISYPTHLRIDSLFAGVTLGYYQHFRSDLFQRLSRWPWWVPAVILVLPALFIPFESGLMATVGLTVLFLGFGGILVWRTNQQPSRNLLARLVAGLGVYSYSIYLWHEMLASWVFRPRTPHLTLFAAYVAASLLLGLCMALVVETPSLALRDKWFPSRSGRLTTPVGQPPAVLEPASIPSAEAWTRRAIHLCALTTAQAIVMEHFEIVAGVYLASWRREAAAT